MVSLFSKKPKPSDCLEEIERGAHAFEHDLEAENQQLKELFVDLKTDLIDEFLRPGSGNIKDDHLRILEEQVRHVISIARTIGYTELVASFEEEQQLLHTLRDLVEQYPGVNVETSPDIRASLGRLRSLLRSQQQLIFSHEEILVEEKRRLIDILNQVAALKVDQEKERNLSPAKEDAPDIQYV